MPSYQWVTGETITAAKLNARPFDVMICGGGGGSGSAGAGSTTAPSGGGGGGGVITRTILPNISDSFAVTIGAGGAGAAAGSSSTFGPLTATGGGAGGNATGVSPNNFPGDGGAAGGLGGIGGIGRFAAPITSFGGGGGGAGGNGAILAGGLGYRAAISGSDAIYGTGGGAQTGSTGSANTGDGGRGTFGPFAGAAGGSGVVIVSYDGPTQATGGTITASGGRTIHTFTSGPATFTWTG